MDPNVAHQKMNDIRKLLLTNVPNVFIEMCNTRRVQDWERSENRWEAVDDLIQVSLCWRPVDAEGSSEDDHTVAGEGTTTEAAFDPLQSTVACLHTSVFVYMCT